MRRAALIFAEPIAAPSRERILLRACARDASRAEWNEAPSHPSPSACSGVIDPETIMAAPTTELTSDADEPEPAKYSCAC